MSNPTRDERPPVAIGHVRHAAKNVAETCDYLVKLGLRHIHQSDNFAVLELRGGTHVVLTGTEEAVPLGSQASFDLIVDNIETARKEYDALGLSPSEIQSGRIHSSFTLVDPSGYSITINSTHAGDRPI